MTAFGASWSFVLGPVVPRQMMYAFQPSLFLLGLMLVGLWLGRFFVILGLVGIVVHHDDLHEFTWSGARKRVETGTE